MKQSLVNKFFQPCNEAFIASHKLHCVSLRLVGALALKLIKDNLAQTEMMRRNLHIFIGFDIFKSFLKAKHHRRNYSRLIVGSRRTHICEFLRFCYVHHYVILLGILTNHLTGIHFLLWEDKESTAVLELVDSVSIGCSCLHSYQRAIGATLYVTFPRLILKEAVRHYCFTCRAGKNIGAKSYDTSRRYIEFKMYAVVLRRH